MYHITPTVLLVHAFNSTHTHAHTDTHTAEHMHLLKSSSALVLCALGFKNKQMGAVGLVHCQSEVFFLCFHSEM